MATRGTGAFPKEQTMNPTSKSTKDAAHGMAGEILDCEALTGLYLKTVERVAEVQKKTLEIAADQNTKTVDFLKKAVKAFPGIPCGYVLEVVEQAFDRF